MSQIEQLIVDNLLISFAIVNITNILKVAQDVNHVFIVIYITLYPA